MPLEQALSLLEAGKSQAALALLLPLEEDNAGILSYDLLLARAYFASKQWSRAKFTLERVLMLQADHIHALLMVAAIHMQNNDTKLARQVLAPLRGKALTPKMQDRIDKIRSQISRSSAKTQPTRIRSHVTYSLGYDTNVTTGPDADSLLLPAVNQQVPVALGTSSEAEDWLSSLKLKTSLFHRLNTKTALLAGLTAKQTINKSRHYTDQGYGGGYLGLSRTFGKNVLTLKGLAQAYQVKNTLYRHHWGVLGSVQHRPNKQEWINGFIRYVDLTFPTLQGHDAYRTGVGMTRHNKWGSSKAATSLFYGVFGNIQRARSNNTAYLGYLTQGAQLGASHQWTPSTKLTAKVRFENRRYEEPENLYQQKRHNHNWVFRLGANYRISDQWTLIPELTHSQHISNLELYHYDRTQWMLSLKWSLNE